jgi:hypothetical protein
LLPVSSTWLLALLLRSLPFVSDGRRSFSLPNQPGCNDHARPFFPRPAFVCPLMRARARSPPSLALFTQAAVLAAVRARSRFRTKLLRTVLGVEIIRRQSIMDFQGDVRGAFLKITLTTPDLVTTARSLFQDGRVPGLPAGTLTFDSNVPFALRFMIDRVSGGRGQFYLRVCHSTSRGTNVWVCQGVAGGQWVRVAPGSWHRRHYDDMVLADRGRTHTPSLLFPTRVPGRLAIASWRWTSILPIWRHCRCKGWVCDVRLRVVSSLCPEPLISR